MGAETRSERQEDEAERGEAVTKEEGASGRPGGMQGWAREGRREKRCKLDRERKTDRETQEDRDPTATRRRAHGRDGEPGRSRGGGRRQAEQTEDRQTEIARQGRGQDPAREVSSTDMKGRPGRRVAGEIKK